jgi:hypothetical protein
MIGLRGRHRWRQQQLFKLRAKPLNFKKAIFYRELRRAAANAADLAPHRKFAIRSTFVRRTTVEQTAENRVVAFLLRALYATAQIRSALCTAISRPTEWRATVATSIAFINGSQRSLPFAGLF